MDRITHSFYRVYGKKNPTITWDSGKDFDKEKQSWEYYFELKEKGYNVKLMNVMETEHEFVKFNNNSFIL